MLSGELHVLVQLHTVHHSLRRSLLLQEGKALAISSGPGAGGLDRFLRNTPCGHGEDEWLVLRSHKHREVLRAGGCSSYMDTFAVAHGNALVSCLI